MPRCPRRPPGACVAPVWLPHIAPAPLCGLGRRRCRATCVARPPARCAALREHLRDLDEWVRQAELACRGQRAATAATPTARGDARSAAANRVHALPF